MPGRDRLGSRVICELYSLIESILAIQFMVNEFADKCHHVAKHGH